MNVRSCACTQGDKPGMGANKHVTCYEYTCMGHLFTGANMHCGQPVGAQMHAHVYEQIPECVGHVCVCTLMQMYMHWLNIHFSVDVLTWHVCICAWVWSCVLRYAFLFFKIYIYIFN